MIETPEFFFEKFLILATSKEVEIFNLGLTIAEYQCKECFLDAFGFSFDNFKTHFFNDFYKEVIQKDIKRPYYKNYPVHWRFRIDNENFQIQNLQKFIDVFIPFFLKNVSTLWIFNVDAKSTLTNIPKEKRKTNWRIEGGLCNETEIRVFNIGTSHKN